MLINISQKRRSNLLYLFEDTAKIQEPFPLREKCPNMELFLVCIFLCSDRITPYLDNFQAMCFSELVLLLFTTSMVACRSLLLR